MKRAGFSLGGLFLAVVLGCGDAAPEPPNPPDDPPPSSPSAFNAETAGTIRGHVAWQGAIPQPAPYRISPSSTPGHVPGNRIRRNNPNAPMIDPETRGVGNAVVHLRGVDANRARPWDHEPVVVELRDHRIELGQRPGPPAYAFVRRGEAIRMVSRQPMFHALHADGASFFTLPFPDPDQPLMRRLDQRGWVELSSSAGYFWMRAYLFVDDHPYYACTAPDGRFELRQVPPGDYELVCWMPNWVEDRRTRDPESGLVTRVYYRPPVQITRRVQVSPRGSCDVRFELSAEVFEHGR